MRKIGLAILLHREWWLPIGCAMLELARARVRLGADHSQHLLTAKDAPRAQIAPLLKDDVDLVDQVAFSIPRVARRVPWRADCLVQALAGEHWLRSRGVSAQVVIGVHKNDATLSAHAWLTAGDRIVVGGDISAYVPLSG